MSGTQMQLEDWLDDLCVRFIINLPQEDLSSVARICFQVEEAQWFYEDFIRPLDPTLPSMSLRTFCLRIFQHCPLLASFSVENHTKAFEEFLQYKTRVPVRGAIMLNHAMDSVVLVKGWKKGANWSFPRGKINKDEDDLDCAVREVYEETGLDLQAAGLVPTESKPKYIEILMREQQLRLYVFRDVPMDTNFEPRTRKEISKIQWYKLSELPAFRKKGGQTNNNDSAAGSQANKFYMVAPFLVPLKKWIVSQKKIAEKRTPANAYFNAHSHLTAEETATTEDDAWPTGKTSMPTKVHAIETLDGATQELQRLLKMQPPTQGLQPAPIQEDKGSALLSILQAGNSNSATLDAPGGHIPQTPLDHVYVEAPQPHNPHHHNNQHSASVNMQQPPPSFALAENHAASSWGHQGAPHSHGRVPQAMTSGQPGIPHAGQPPPYNSQTNLVHPQPLPPQVQRAMFNNSTFQEVRQPNAQWAGSGSAQGPPAAAPHDGQAHQILPQQQHIPANNPPPVQLNGQSMALLNAFKRGAVQGRDNGRPQPIPETRPAAGAYEAQAQHPAPRGQHFAPPQQQAVHELGGPGARAPADNHRSALLGMFKKEESDAAPLPPQDILQQQANHANRAYGAACSPQADMLWQKSHRANTADALHGSMNHLSLHSRPNQSGMPLSPHVHYAATSSSPSTGSYPTNARMPQPTRILQRGQDIHELNAVEQSAMPRQSPAAFGRRDLPHPSQAGIPSPGASLASPGQSHAQTKAPSDQKRQLLSLFAKQSSPASSSIHEQRPGSQHSGDQPRRGQETPISPADQTFLLDYLQSVTNKATH